jgi:hypothetical protein
MILSEAGACLPAMKGLRKVEPDVLVGLIDAPGSPTRTSGSTHCHQF